ncbi:MAG TPA: hypothetical protein VG873_10065 [Burkholderiales bacterium]|nr:hypothetical protein [Burkholderiales bacterium]
MKIGNRVACILVVGLAGCSSSPYVPPTGGDVATLTLRNDTPFDGGATTYKVAEDCRHMLDLATLKARTEQRVVIPAGAPWSVTVYTAGYQRTCHTTGTFLPAKGGDYRLVYRMPPDFLSCSISVVDAASGQVHPMVYKRTLGDGFAADRAMCGPR